MENKIIFQMENTGIIGYNNNNHIETENDVIIGSNIKHNDIKKWIINSTIKIII